MPNSLSFNVISYLRLASNPAKESWKRFVNVALIIGFQLGILADYPAEASMDNNSGENVLSSNKLITRGKRRGIPAKIDLEWQHLAYRILLLTGWLPLPQKSVIRQTTRAISRHAQYRLLRRSIAALDHLYFPIWRIYLACTVPWYRRAPLVIETARYRPVPTTSRTPARSFIIGNHCDRKRVASIRNEPLLRCPHRGWW